jgi:hypothetical protein
VTGTNWVRAANTTCEHLAGAMSAVSSLAQNPRLLIEDPGTAESLRRYLTMQATRLTGLAGLLDRDTDDHRSRDG